MPAVPSPISTATFIGQQAAHNSQNGDANDGTSILDVTLRTELGAAINPSIVTNREVASTASTGQVSVTTAATLIHAATTGRNFLSVRNIGGTDCYLGVTSGVLTTTGYLLKASEVFDVKFTGTVYALTATGTTTLAFYEEIA